MGFKNPQEPTIYNDQKYGKREESCVGNDLLRYLMGTKEFF